MMMTKIPMLVMNQRRSCSGLTMVRTRRLKKTETTIMRMRIGRKMTKKILMALMRSRLTTRPLDKARILMRAE